MITVKNLVKKYGLGKNEVPVLKNLSLEIADGEFVSITGRSGSGKSTLLYQLSLLDEPESGEILVNGIDISQLSKKQRTEFRLAYLGYVFQDYELLPELNAVENVAVPLIMRGDPVPEAEAKAVAVLERVGLKGKVYNLPSELSGGQQQLVSIARAIVNEPKIMFADEPTANLDTQTAQMILETFIELNKAGQTIVMVTHEMEYARLAHRMIVLKDGAIVTE